MGSTIPQAGETFSLEDMEMVFEAVKERQEKHPEEAAGLSLWVVFSQIGERFRKVQCVEQEWEGVKQDIPVSLGDPKCPNGHSLHAGSGLRIGWLAVE